MVRTAAQAIIWKILSLLSRICVLDGSLVNRPVDNLQRKGLDVGVRGNLYVASLPLLLPGPSTTELRLTAS